MAKPKCGERRRTRKGIILYVGTTCPAGKALVRAVTRIVKRDLGLK